MSEGGRAAHPVVCLVCGQVLDANGRGECTMHAKSCGCGVGIFFLLQVRVKRLVIMLQSDYVEVFLFLA